MKKKIEHVAEMDEIVRQGDYDTAWELEELREVCERAHKTLDVLDRRVNAIQELAWARSLVIRAVLIMIGMWWAAHLLAEVLS